MAKEIETQGAMCIDGNKSRINANAAKKEASIIDTSLILFIVRPPLHHQNLKGDKCLFSGERYPAFSWAIPLSPSGIALCDFCSPWVLDHDSIFIINDDLKIRYKQFEFSDK